MNKISPILLGLSLAVAGSSIAAAQHTASMPKVLQITREFIKPYKGGAAHDKTESAFVVAMAKAKFPAYYVGLDSLSGKSRALFLTGYDSFDTWEEDNKLVDKNPALSAELERASIADGELLDEVDSGVFTFSEELSYRPHADISHARYMEITEFHIRLGHTGDWHKLTKMYKDVEFRDLHVSRMRYVCMRPVTQFFAELPESTSSNSSPSAMLARSNSAERRRVLVDEFVVLFPSIK